MATRKSAAKTTGTAARKSPAKAAAKESDVKPAAKSPPKSAAAPRRRAAAPVPAPAPAPAAVPITRQPAAEPMSPEARYRWIAYAAYLRAEKRGFAPGQEVEDWLAAEADFLAAHGSKHA